MLQLSGVSYRYAGYSNEVLHDIDLRSDGVDDDLCAGGGDDRGWRYRAGIVLRL